jgi:RNA polymerase sigma-B factor
LVIIADLTATSFCDSAGWRHLLLAYRQAAAAGAQLRLAIPPHGPVGRVVQLTGIGRHVPVYPSSGGYFIRLNDANVVSNGQRQLPSEGGGHDLLQLPSSLRPGKTAMTWHSDLRELSDNELLARLRATPRADSGRAAVCEVLVERYAHLVQACVRPYRRSPEPVEDLMQVGYVGLLKAINGFDPAIGDSLSAYATPCISGEVKRHFRDRRWQVRVRRPVQELLLEMRAAAGDLAQELGHAPSDGDLAAALGVTEDEIREAYQASLAFSASSLDAPLSDSEDAAILADVLGEDDQAFEHAIDMDAVQVHLEELPEREQRILALRFYGNLTQGEIGQRLGISQMHVSRLLSRALAYLRDKLTSEPGDGPVMSHGLGADPASL